MTIDENKRKNKNLRKRYYDQKSITSSAISTNSLKSMHVVFFIQFITKNDTAQTFGGSKKSIQRVRHRSKNKKNEDLIRKLVVK